MTFNKEKPFFKIRSKQFILAVMALSCIWTLQFISKLNFPFELISVDVSWMLSLSNAWEQHKIWGEEIVFTYGPLSFLSTRVVINGSAWPLIVFDSYFAASFLYILYKIVLNPFSWRRATLILATCFFYKQAMLMFLVFTLQLIAILYLHFYRKERNWILFVQAIILTTLIFYIKFNMAFISIFIFMLYLLYLIKLKELPWLHAFAVFVALLGAIVLASFVLPIDLLKYIRTGIEVIVSYSDAVYIYPKTFLEKGLAGIILSVFFVGIVFILRETKYHSSEHRIISGVFILLLFVIFKQSYVRADLDHLKDFFYCAPPCILVFIYVSKSKLEFIQFPILLLWIVGISLTISFKDYFYPFKKIVAFPVYAYSHFDRPDYYEHASKRVLPEHIKKTIVNASVDIIPWEISLPILNKLNYHPRPVIQSYQAYNETLDKLNEAVYDWEDAPEYVMYNTNSIDQHYNFFDDTHLKKALYSHYDITDTFMCNKEEIVLFRKISMRKQLNFVKIASEERALHDTIHIPSSNYPLMVKIKIKYSWFGEFQKVLLRTPYSEIEMHMNDSSSTTFQAATSILQGGVFVDHYIETRNEALQFFNNQPIEKNKIKSIQLHVGNQVCWSDMVEYEWYELR